MVQQSEHLRFAREAGERSGIAREVFEQNFQNKVATELAIVDPTLPASPE
jgi:hypothetical protein